MVLPAQQLQVRQIRFAAACPVMVVMRLTVAGRAIASGRGAVTIPHDEGSPL